LSLRWLVAGLAMVLVAMASSAQAQRIIRTSGGLTGDQFYPVVPGGLRDCSPGDFVNIDANGGPAPADACGGQRQAPYGLGEIAAFAAFVGNGTWALTYSDSRVFEDVVPAASGQFDARSFTVTTTNGLLSKVTGRIQLPGEYTGSFVAVLSGTWLDSSDPLALSARTRTWNAAYLWNNVSVQRTFAPNGALLAEPGLSFNLREPLPGMQVTQVDFYTFAPIPEPGTYALMGLGLLGVAAVARRRRAASAPR
jgi:hypothetical protein